MSLEKARGLCEKVVVFANQKKQEALSEKNLVKWMEACDNLFDSLDPTNFVWIYSTKGYEDYSIEDHKESSSQKHNQKAYLKESKLAKEMYSVLSALSCEKDFAKMAFRRYRDNDRGIWSYRVLSILPKETKLNYPPLFAEDIKGDSFMSIYYLANAACMNHACDVLYKELKEKNGAGTFKVNDNNLFSIISGGGLIEFMDLHTKKTKDPANFVLAGIVGYFSKQKRYAIPSSLLEQKNI